MSTYQNRLTSSRGVACLIVIASHCVGIFPAVARVDACEALICPGLSWLFLQQVLNFAFNGEAAVMGSSH